MNARDIRQAIQASLKDNFSAIVIIAISAIIFFVIAVALIYLIFNFFFEIHVNLRQVLSLALVFTVMAGLFFKEL